MESTNEVNHRRIERLGTWQAAPGPEGLIWNQETKLMYVQNSTIIIKIPSCH